MSAEAAAPVISRWLYGKSGSELSAEEKETVAGITRLLGTGAGALAGGTDTVGGSVSGSLSAGNAVEYNYLTGKQMYEYGKEVMACTKSANPQSCLDSVDGKYHALHQKNERAFDAACAQGMESAACVSHRSQVMDGDAAWANKDIAYLSSVANHWQLELKQLGCNENEACRSRMSIMDNINVSSYKDHSDLDVKAYNAAKGFVEGLGGSMERLSVEARANSGLAFAELVNNGISSVGVKGKSVKEVPNLPTPQKTRPLPTFRTDLPQGYQMIEKGRIIIGPKGGRYIRSETYSYKDQPLYQHHSSYYTFANGNKQVVRVRNNPDVMRNPK
ncbi:hypothetical protein L1281_002582 [Neisseria sp. HSC-16F19]|nr:hypothetical protein [Neisseria sp. HSC-16F19]